MRPVKPHFGNLICQYQCITVSLWEPQKTLSYIILLLTSDKLKEKAFLPLASASAYETAVEIPWRSTPQCMVFWAGRRPHSRGKRCAREKSAFATRKSRVSLGSLKSGMSRMVDISCLGLSVIFFSFPSCLANKALCQGQSVPCTSKYSILQLPYGI